MTEPVPAVRQRRSVLRGASGVVAACVVILLLVGRL